MRKIPNFKFLFPRVRLLVAEQIFLSIVLLGFITGILYLTSSVLAQESTPETSVAPVNQEKVQELKEKLATKVAELRESQKRGFYGTVEALSKTSFTLVTADGEIRVKLNDDTVIKDSTNKTLQVTDLKNTQTVSVLGLFDEDTHQAKVILVKTTPMVFVGIVQSTDQKEGTISVKTPAGDLFTYDYERTTSADEYSSQDKKIAKSGLSRIDAGDHLIVWGTESIEDQDRYTAIKMLRLPATFVSGGTIQGDTTEASGSASPKASAATSPAGSPRTSPRSSPRNTPRTSPRATPQN